jgi:hypothetical protein
VKRWHYFVLAAVAAAGALYVYSHRETLGNLTRVWGNSADRTAESESPRPLGAGWQTVDRSAEGFKIELPGEPKDLVAPAFNETGGAEPIRMLVASPGPDTSFVLTWQDNPPVARVNNHAPDRTLNMARDGMLARTQTMIVNESLSLQRGNPSLDVSARNAGGGVLEARLILVGNRLYILMALFPSAGARREKDVSRFFDSFAASRPATIPETMPTASRQY